MTRRSTFARIALLALFASAALAPRALAQQDATGRVIDPARLEALVDGVVGQALASEPVAGVSVAIVDRQGDLLIKAYGQATPERAADAATLFRVGSISKTFVWIALMQLVEQGKLSLDDPINDKLPEALRVPDEGFAEPIRVRHLMSHNAGFEDSILGHLFESDPNDIQPLNEYLAKHRVHRVRPPGVRAAYSNYGAALAGALVAHVSGELWEDYSERRILRPLGMATATYRDPYAAELASAHGLPAPMPAEVAARLTDGWSIDGARAVPQAHEFVAQAAPAGSASADARDMAAYMSALLDPARFEAAGVLKAETVLAMREPLFSNLEGFAPLRHGFIDYRIPGGSLALGHDGGLMFQHARMVVAPELGIGVYFGINTAGGGDLHQNLLALVVREFFGAGEPVVARYDADAPAAAAAVAGTYLGLRRPYYRTERALMNGLSAASVSATPEGDLLVPSFTGKVRRYVPLGNNRWSTADGLDVMAVVTENGRTIAFDSIGVMPFERLGLLDRPILWMAFFVLAHLVVVAALVGVVRARRRRGELLSGPSGSGPAYAVAMLLWAVALALFWAGLLPLASPAAAVFGYPGALLPIACWLLAAAALATAVALGAFAFGARGAERGRWRRASALVLLGLCSVLLWRAGLLGFSGW